MTNPGTGEGWGVAPDDDQNPRSESNTSLTYVEAHTCGSDRERYLEHTLKQAIARLYVIKDPLPPGGIRKDLADLVGELQVAVGR